MMVLCATRLTTAVLVVVGVPAFITAQAPRSNPARPSAVALLERLKQERITTAGTTRVEVVRLAPFCAAHLVYTLTITLR